MLPHGCENSSGDPCTFLNRSWMCEDVWMYHIKTSMRYFKTITAKVQCIGHNPVTIKKNIELSTLKQQLKTVF